MPPPTSWPLAAAAALVALAVLLSVFRLLSRAWPEHLPWGAAPVILPACALLGGLAFLAAVPGATAADAAHVAAMRLEDGPPYGARTFHLVAWPLAGVLGEPLAVGVVGALSFAIALLLVHALARSVGADPITAVVAQALLLATPEIRAPLVGGRLPSLLGIAGEIALLVHLARRLPVLEAARDGAAACAFLFGAQALYSGAVPVTLACVLAAAAAEVLAGHRRRARWLLGAYGIALALVFVTEQAWSALALTREGLATDAASLSVAPLAALARVDTLVRVVLAVGLLAVGGPPGAAVRTQVAALVASAAVVALSLRLPALAEHALAFGAAPLAAMAAVTAAILARRSRALAALAAAAVILALVAGACGY